MDLIPFSVLVKWKFNLACAILRDSLEKTVSQSGKTLFVKRKKTFANKFREMQRNISSHFAKKIGIFSLNRKSSRKMESHDRLIFFRYMQMLLNRTFAQWKPTVVLCLNSFAIKYILFSVPFAVGNFLFVFIFRWMQ